jgi:hypothetical protein
MKPTYTIVKNNFGQNIIFRDNGDGSITSFMEDPANSDYQAYLNKDKAEQSTPSVIDEA